MSETQPPPNAQAPERFREANLVVEGRAPDLPAGAGWWSVFADPSLDALEQAALHGNPGLAQAAGMTGRAGIGPSGYAFAIWGLIFLLDLVYAGWQLTGARKTDDTLQRVAPWAAGGFALTTIWMPLFAMSQFWLCLLVIFGATACLILRRDRCCKTGNDRAERCAGTQSSKATLLSRPHHHTGFAQHLHDPPPIATAEVRSGAAIAANKGRVARALSVHPFVELAERKTLAFDAALGEVVRIKRTLDV